jgi:2-aminoethylphosphonate transport system permease protein
VVVIRNDCVDGAWRGLRLAGSWTDALPSGLGFGHFDDALSGENLASLSVSLQTAFISGGLALVLGT